MAAGGLRLCQAPCSCHQGRRQYPCIEIV